MGSGLFSQKMLVWGRFLNISYRRSVEKVFNGNTNRFSRSYSGTSLTDDEDDDIMKLIISSFKVGERFSP